LLAPFDSTGKVKGTKLQHLQGLPKAAKPKALDYPDYPESMGYLMNHFYTVRKATQQKISYTELKNYIDVCRLDLNGWEIDAIMNIDSIYEGGISGRS
jgi:hypothetical protein